MFIYLEAKGEDNLLGIFYAENVDLLPPPNVTYFPSHLPAAFLGNLELDANEHVYAILRFTECLHVFPFQHLILNLNVIFVIREDLSLS